MKLPRTDFDIELSQIHSFEKNNYNVEGYRLTENFCYDVLFKMKSIYIELTEPFLVYVKYDDPFWHEKYEQMVFYNTIKNPFYGDLIYKTNKFYTFNDPIIVSFETQDFHLWFAMKLRQFDKSLFEVKDFLEYHLLKEFNNIIFKFIDFVKLVIRQYADELFNPNLTVTIQEWIAIHEKQSNSKKAIKKISPKSTNKISPKSIEGKFTSFLLAKSNVKAQRLQDGNPIMWTDLKDELVSTGFLDKGNTAKQLKEIFQNINISKGSRVIWKGSNIELKWFLDYLIKKNGIVEDPKNDIWYLATKCFVKANGTEYLIEQLSKANGKNLKRKDLLYQSLDKFFV